MDEITDIRAPWFALISVRMGWPGLLCIKAPGHPLTGQVKVNNQA